MLEAVPVAFLRGIAALMLLLVATARAQPVEEPLTLPDTQLEPVGWADVEGWSTDDHLAAFSTEKDLPRAPVRIARLHLQITGPTTPKFDTKLTLAADPQGKSIPATLKLQQGETR